MVCHPNAPVTARRNLTLRPSRRAGVGPAAGQPGWPGVHHLGQAAQPGRGQLAGRCPSVAPLTLRGPMLASAAGGQGRPSRSGPLGRERDPADLAGRAAGQPGDGDRGDPLAVPGGRGHEFQPLAAGRQVDDSIGRGRQPEHVRPAARRGAAGRRPRSSARSRRREPCAGAPPVQAGPAHRHEPSGSAQSTDTIAPGTSLGCRWVPAMSGRSAVQTTRTPRSASRALAAARSGTWKIAMYPPSPPRRSR